MESLVAAAAAISDTLVLARIYSGASTATASSSPLRHHQLNCFFSSLPIRRSPSLTGSSLTLRIDHGHSRFSPPLTTCSPSTACSVSPNSKVYIVGDFMTMKEDLRVVKPTTTVDEALEMLVEHRITGFPVIDDDWKLVGLVSDYDLLALDSISGGGRADPSMFPEVDSTWRTFNEIQKLLSKTNGKVIADVMTPAPLVVHETTNLEDVARLLLETKYRRLPVVDSGGKLVGIITRGNVVRAALQIKRETENMDNP